MSEPILPARHHSTLDRTTFGDLVRQCAEEFSLRSSGGDFPAAQFKQRLQDVLRARLGNPDVELSGSLYGPILFPTLNSTHHAVLKFRDFLCEFPGIIEVSRTRSGDRLRAVFASPDSRIPAPIGGTLEAQFMDILETFRELSARNPIPHREFAKLLSRISPDLISWLEKTGTVNAPEIPAPPVLSEKTSNVSADTGCLVVDGVDLIRAMTKIFGRKPSTQYLPQWHRVFEHVRESLSAQEWKAFYFMTIDPHSHSEGVDKLRGYLEAAHFRVVQTPVPAPDSMVSLDTLLAQRANINERYVSQMLTHVHAHNCGHVALVSHSGAMVEPLMKLLSNRNNASVAVIGFPEQMHRGIIELERRGLRIIDIERDIVGAFTKRLSRRAFNSPQSFDAKTLWDASHRTLPKLS